MANKARVRFNAANILEVEFASNRFKRIDGTVGRVINMFRGIASGSTTGTEYWMVEGKPYAIHVEGTATGSGNAVINVPGKIKNSHKYLYMWDYDDNEYNRHTVTPTIFGDASTKTKKAGFLTTGTTVTTHQVTFKPTSGQPYFDTLYILLVDLTEMYGAGNEPDSLNHPDVKKMLEPVNFKFTDPESYFIKTKVQPSEVYGYTYTYEGLLPLVGDDQEGGGA